MIAATSQSSPLRSRVRTVTDQLAVDEIQVSDMSRAGALEFDQTLNRGPAEDHSDAHRISRLEGTIEAKPVPRHIGSSPLRYFLDGSQKTLPVWRVGTVPIIASVTAAGILERTSPTDVRILPDTLVARVHWILPRGTDNPVLNRIVELLELTGESVVDPLDTSHGDDPESYRRMSNSYTYLLEQSQATASNLRAQTERDLLRLWQQDVSRFDRHGWIVVDGRLRTDIPNAIGLVKNAQAQHFTGEEAVALFDLVAGERTGAYVSIYGDEQHLTGPAMWFLRLQNATGLDARHGLIRLETPAIIAEPDLIDQISSWILAERAPRASMDARWATLLYPIHLLERMLKRRIQTITAGWPA